MFVAEFFLWILAVGSFLVFYIIGHGASGSVALPHIGLVFSGWLLLASLRLLNWKLALGRGCSFMKFSYAKYVAVVLWCVPLLILFSYYVFAVLGLLFWGRVSTWSLVEVYAFQGGLLASFFGFEWWLFVFLLILFIVPFLFVYFVVVGSVLLGVCLCCLICVVCCAVLFVCLFVCSFVCFVFVCLFVCLFIGLCVFG